jgi:hypothetical protein
MPVGSQVVFPSSSERASLDAPRGSGAAVAHNLAKVGVAGSNPVFRSKEGPAQGQFSGNCSAGVRTGLY